MKVERIDSAARAAAKAAAEAAVRRETREAHRPLLEELFHRIAVLKDVEGVAEEDIHIDFTPEEAEILRRTGYLNWANRFRYRWALGSDGRIVFLDY